jgi:hypothetical protein
LSQLGNLTNGRDGLGYLPNMSVWILEVGSTEPPLSIYGLPDKLDPAGNEIGINGVHIVDERYELRAGSGRRLYRDGLGGKQIMRGGGTQECDGNGLQLDESAVFIRLVRLQAKRIQIEPLGSLDIGHKQHDDIHSFQGHTHFGVSPLWSTADLSLVRPYVELS